MAGQLTIASFFAPAPSRDKASGERKKKGLDLPGAGGGENPRKQKQEGSRPATGGTPSKKRVAVDLSAAAPEPAASEKPAETKEDPVAATEKVAEPDAPAPAPREDHVGKRIRVWWSSEKEFFAGTVAAAKKDGSKVRVDYDDGDVEWITLGKRRHEFVPQLDDDVDGEKTKARASKRRRMERIAEDDDDDDDVSMSEANDEEEDDKDVDSDSDFCADNKDEAPSDVDDEDFDDDDDDDSSFEEEETTPKKKRASPSKKKKLGGVRLGGGGSGDPVKKAKAEHRDAMAGPQTPPQTTAAATVTAPKPSEAAKEAFKRKILDEEEGAIAIGASRRSQFSQRERERFPFLLPERIRDASKLRPADPEYDPSTLHIPTNWFKQEKISPGQQQWWEFKSKNFDAVLLFKMGKFYEMYEMDAHIGVEHLGLIYMRGDQPHCGFPERAYSNNAEKLARKGYKVVVVEQTETPEQLKERNEERKRKGLKKAVVVNRDKVAVLSPGTLFDYDMVKNTKENSYIVAICEGAVAGDSSAGAERLAFGVAAVDVTIGRMIVGELADNASRTKLTTFLASIDPAEVIIPKESDKDDKGAAPRLGRETREMLRRVLPCARFTELIPDTQFWRANRAVEEISAYYEGGEGEQGRSACLPRTIADMVSSAPESAQSLNALGGMTSFLQRSMLDRAVIPVCQYELLPKDGIPRLADADASSGGGNAGVRLDASALANLEIIENGDGGQEGTLLSQLDQCASGPGHRLLRNWLLHPLKTTSAISARQEAIEEIAGARCAGDLHAGLRSVPDLERCLTRMAASSVGSGREREGVVLYEDVGKRRLRAFLATLRGFKKLRTLLERIGGEREWKAPLVSGILASLDWTTLEDFEKEFDWSQADKDGKIIPSANFPSYRENLGKVDEVKSELGDYLSQQRRAVRGVKWVSEQLEVPEKTDVPRNWELTSQRKGKQAVRRYQTSEVREILATKTAAEEEVERTILEYLRSLIAKFCKHHEVWQRAVEAGAKLDVLCALSMVPDDWCRPKLIEAERGAFGAEGLSHPSGGCNFVPNDIHLGGAKSFALLTGPNMGGKSTVMRQVCLATILAQIGARVPAISCELTPVDAIFVRMGARDSILTGQSTWSTELLDCNSMLHQATSHSLVVLDEFGRGTTTSDGIALAAAVMKWLVKRRCLALFSTHYHLLAESVHQGGGGDDDNILLCHMACEVDEKDQVTFLYKIRQGVCPSSYGVNVAALAGLPEKVLKRATEIISNQSK